MEAAYHVPVSSSIELYFPDTFLIGEHDITTFAPSFIDRYMSKPVSNTKQTNTDTTAATKFSKRIADRFSRYSLLTIITAGIIDGINPCAIATMIFLISFLAMQKRKRREVLTIGLAFTLSVFVTYLLMGIGAFKTLTFLSTYSWISTVIRWSAAVLAAGVGILSFRDALVYRSTKKTSDISL